MGTLYRHFPTKEKLCEAILLERLVGADGRTPGRWPTPRTRQPPSSASSSTWCEEGAAKRDLVVAVMGRT